MKNKKQLLIASIIYISYVILITASNKLMELSISENNETYEMISGILFGFVAIPIFSILLPVLFAKKWKLDFSFWPKTKNVFLVIAVLLLYMTVANFEALKSLIESNISARDFAIHYLSAMLFHVTYYPLFVMLIFPVLRKNFGLIISLIVTALLFALYHMAQYHFFPEGTTFMLQLFLFVTFIVSLLLYLWSESLILVSLVHCTSGAIGLVANGTIFNEADFLFYLTIIIVGSLFGYMIYNTIKKKDSKYFNNKKWLNINIWK